MALQITAMVWCPIELFQRSSDEALSSSTLGFNLG